MTEARAPDEVVLVIDVANAVGAVPDGWWRDRPAATAKLVGAMARLPGHPLPAGLGPGSEPGRVGRVVAVVEGSGRDVAQPDGVELVRALGSGDDAIVECAWRLVDEGQLLAVVTADRALRARLPDSARLLSPAWLRRQL